MNSRVGIPVIALVWIVIGIIVAINQDYGRQIDNASHAATFVLGVILWPILATGGDVAIRF